MTADVLRDRPVGKLQRLFSSFWPLQLVGWAVYGVLIYITFLTVVAPQARYNLLQVKVSRTIAGFLLTCVMRLLYKRIEVANTGQLVNKSGNGSGTKIGLNNVRKRLAQVYPEKSNFTLRESDGWIRARIEIRG